MMTPSTNPVRGWTWYATRIRTARPHTTGHPFDGLDVRPMARLLCPVRSSAGLANRFPDDTTPGWLLVTETPVAPEVGEAWQIEAAELGPGFAAGSVRLLKVVGSEENRWG